MRGGYCSARRELSRPPAPGARRRLRPQLPERRPLPPPPRTDTPAASARPAARRTPRSGTTARPGDPASTRSRGTPLPTDPPNMSLRRLLVVGLPHHLPLRLPALPQRHRREPPADHRALEAQEPRHAAELQHDPAADVSRIRCTSSSLRASIMVSDTAPGRGRVPGPDRGAHAEAHRSHGHRLHLHLHAELLHQGRAIEVALHPLDAVVARGDEVDARQRDRRAGGRQASERASVGAPHDPAEDDLARSGLPIVHLLEDEVGKRGPQRAGVVAERARPRSARRCSDPRKCRRDGSSRPAEPRPSRSTRPRSAARRPCRSSCALPNGFTHAARAGAPSPENRGSGQSQLSVRLDAEPGGDAAPLGEACRHLAQARPPRPACRSARPRSDSGARTGLRACSSSSARIASASARFPATPSTYPSAPSRSDQRPDRATPSRANASASASRPRQQSGRAMVSYAVTNDGSISSSRWQWPTASS